MSSADRNVESSQHLIAPLLQEPVKRYLLDNGLTVALKPDHSCEVCSAQVWIKSGSIHEGRFCGSGISHFVEHMLFKGTQRRGGKEIAATVQEAGGYINAYTTFDRTVYYIDMPAENVDVALDVLEDAVFHSTFPAEEVAKEKEVILREIDMGEDDPDVKLSHALFETAFHQHPYRYPIIGYKQVFSALTREDLLEYYSQRYAPNNAVLIVTGDFDESRIEQQVESRFGAVARRALANVYLPTEPLQLAPREREMREDVQISRIGLGFQSPGITHEDTPVLDALSLVLGHGNSSILNQRLREEQRVVHAVDTSNWTPGTVGVFYIAMICDPDKRDAALAALRKLLDGLRPEDFSEELVGKAVRQLLAAEINSRKTVSGQASRLGAAEVVVGDIGYAKSYLERVSRIRALDLYRVLREWLRWNRLTTVTMDPKLPAAPGAKTAQAARASNDFVDLRQPNGSALLLRENRRLPNLHFRLVMQSGSLFERSGQQGLTALTATLLTKDTAKRKAGEVSESIESVGGSFQEFSGNNSIGLAMEVMPSDVDLALDLLEEAVLHPAFSEDTFQLEKESHLASIKEQMDDVVWQGRRHLRQRFFGQHPFRVGSSGSLETVEPLTVEDARSFWARMLVSGNVALAVSGDFERKELEPRLAAFLGRLPEGKLERPAWPLERPSEAAVHRVPMERNQAVVYHAYRGPGLLDRDYYVSEVADELFSGMSSELFARVREELSLAYFVRSSRVVGLDTAMFYFYAGTAPDRYPEVIAELEKEVRRVQEGRISQEELARCQARLKASRRMSMQTNGACAGQAAMNVAYGLPANDWRNYDARIDAVTIDALQAFACEYLRPEERVEVVVGAV